MNTENWNAFAGAAAEDVQHRESLGEICGQEIQLYQQTLFCRKVHPQGDADHEVFVNDDSGRRTVRISWIG